MSAEEGREYEYHCAACTGPVAESDFETGKAIRREGAVYCRKCFRQKFPDECEKHPGTKLTVLCAVCGKLNCANCVIDIQDKKVCERCKDWALGRIEKGLPLERPGMPPWESWDQKAVRDWVSRSPRNWMRDVVISVACVAFAFAFYEGIFTYDPGLNALGFLIAIAAFGANLYFSSWKYWRKKHLLRSMYIDQSSIITHTFSDTPRGTRWENARNVTMYMDSGFTRTLSITVRTQPGKIKIPAGRFARFEEIARAVREICREKGIPCFEQRKFTLSLDSLRRRLLNECALHPGMKLTLRCDACKRKCCEKCITEHKGSRLCVRCMEWATGGLDFTMHDMAKKPVVRYAILIIGIFAVPVISACLTGLFDNVDFMVYGIPVLYGVLLVAYAVFVFPRRLESVTLTHESAKGYYYSGKMAEVSFFETTGVVCGGSGTRAYVVVHSPQGSLKIHGRFPRFHELAYRIENICKNRNIPFEQS